MLIQGPILGLLACPALADATLDQLIGVRISQYAQEKVLGSPPLPSLEEDSSNHIVPQLAYVVSSASGSNSVDYQTASYSGTQNGFSLGVGFTSQTTSSLSFYAFALYDYLKAAFQSAPAWMSMEMSRLSRQISRI
jgi:hypothetical protein